MLRLCRGLPGLPRFACVRREAVIGFPEDLRHSTVAVGQDARDGDGSKRRSVLDQLVHAPDRVRLAEQLVVYLAEPLTQEPVHRTALGDFPPQRAGVGDFLGGNSPSCWRCRINHRMCAGMLRVLRVVRHALHRHLVSTKGNKVTPAQLAAVAVGSPSQQQHVAGVQGGHAQG